MNPSAQIYYLMQRLKAYEAGQQNRKNIIMKENTDQATTVNSYMDITPLEGLQMLVEHEGLPVFNVAMRDELNEKWTEMDLLGVKVGNTTVRPFQNVKSWKQCAKVTKINPSQAPDGCPELEPWMAYVGKNPMNDAPDSGSHRNKFLRPSVLTKCWNSGNGNCDYHYAIDVRTAFAKEHFSEHCRIRNYQEPRPFDLWWAEHGESKVALEYMCQAAFNCGTKNPQPTK